MKIIWNKLEIDTKIYTKFIDRLLGLMFIKNKIDYAVCFPKCNSIHTFFMRQNIDVIMTDKNYQIIYIFKNLKPWKIILPKKDVYYTFEFSTNRINYQIGDFIKIKKS